MEIYTKVAGLKYEGRDKYVRETRKGQRVRLRRNENNPYDSNAIEVINSNGNMLGFIPKDIAAQLAPQIDAGKLYVATVSEVTGFKYGEDLGVSLLVESVELEEKLLNCCECGKQLSDRSNACPHCGCPTIETLKTIFRIEGTKILGSSYGDNRRIVVIPQFVTEIDSYAFQWKDNIIQVIIRGEDVVIGDNAFSGCESLQSVIVEGTIKQIGIHAFGGCRSLERINLPDGLLSIQAEAFSTCKGLTGLYIPNSVEHIADNAFEGCTNIKIPSTDMFHFYGSNVFKNREFKNSSYVKRIITSYKGGKYNLVGLKEDGSIIVNFEGKYADFQRNFDDWSNIVSISMDGKIIIGLKDDGTLLISPPDNDTIFDNNDDVLKWSNLVSAEITNYSSYSREYNDTKYVDYFICIGVKETGDICISIPNEYIQYPEYKPEWCDEILDWKDIAMVSADKYIVGLKKDGTVVITGNEVDEVKDMQEVISAWKDIEYILTSNYLVVGIKNDKTVVAAGKIAFYYEVADYEYERELSNVNKSLSLVTNWENIERVSIVGKTIYGIRDDGRVYSVAAVSDDAYDEYDNEYDDEYDYDYNDEYDTEHDDSSNNGLTNFKNIYDIIEGCKGNYYSQQIIFIKKDGTVETIYNNKPSQVDRATQVMGEIKEWKLLDVETDPDMCIEEVQDNSDDFDFLQRYNRPHMEDIEDSGYTLADFGYSQEEYDNYWESTDY